MVPQLKISVFGEGAGVRDVIGARLSGTVRSFTTISRARGNEVRRMTEIADGGLPRSRYMVDRAGTKVAAGT